jgi:hypothetical protein
MSSWNDVDPEILVRAFDEPLVFIEAILPHLPLKLSPNQIKILETFYDPKKKYTELLIAAGRKSGKTLLVSIIALYEVFRLLLTENLHEKYHLIPNSPIYIMITATSREQALDVTFQYIRSLAQGSWYLNDYVTRVTSEEIEFTKNIIIRCQACSSSSGRGYPSFCNIYDEHAHMKLRSGNAGGDVIYEALQPNLKIFKGDGKTITISSPSGMEGIFWELFSTGDPVDVIQKTEHQGEQPWRAVFQHPTWEMNPELGRNHPEIEKEFQSDYKSAEMEYGALFANVVDAALEPKAIDECALGVQIQPDVAERTISRIIVLDPATVGNEYAVTMGHLSDSPKKDMVIVDLVKTFSGSHKHPVDIEEVENFVRLLCRNFKIVHIGIDQHQSADTVQKFQKEGLPIKMVNITPKYNEDMYKTFFRRINTKHIVYPNLPEIKDELRFLQKRFVGWGWIVTAARGHMDDIPDCIANLCLLLEQLLSKKAEWSTMIRAITYEQEMEINHKCPKCGHEWTTVETIPFELEPPEWEGEPD